MEFIFLILCFLILFLIYVYAENKLLIINRYYVESGLKKNGKKLRIVQISDIHKKRCERQIVSKVRQLNPDVVFLTGDVVSRNENDFSHMEYLIKSLSEVCPVYACAGNHELDLSKQQRETYMGIMNKYGVNYLEDKQLFFEKEGIGLKIAGTALKRGVYKNPDGRYSNLENITADELEDGLGKKDGYTILLAHNPLCCDAYEQWGADIVFCGHVHGGIVNLPVIGGVLSPERKFFPKYSKGLYKKGKMQMIVSGGIGKLRVFNPSEIIVCEINV